MSLSLLRCWPFFLWCLWLLFQGLTGALGSGLSSGLGDIGSGLPVDAMRLYSSMPVLEDGLSSGHASDTDNNNPTVSNDLPLIHCIILALETYSMCLSFRSC